MRLPPLVLVMIAAALALVLPGCRSAARPPTTSPNPIIEEPLHILYYEWSGSSPGAGFTRTDLHAVEIDFVSLHRREVRATAHRPDPMIASPGESPPRSLEQAPWSPLATDRAEAIVSAVRGWLEAGPEPTSDHARSIGRESAYLLRCTVRTTRRTYLVRVNPPPGEGVPARHHPAHPEFLELVRVLAGDRPLG